MQALKLPNKPWTDISIDFVTGLLPSRDLATNISYNAIKVVIYQFTKEAEIILFRNNYTAEQLAYIFYNRIIRHYSILKSIISDRDKLFISNF
jgi:hypothetical protein